MSSWVDASRVITPIVTARHSTRPTFALLHPPSPLTPSLTTPSLTSKPNLNLDSNPYPPSTAQVYDANDGFITWWNETRPNATVYHPISSLDSKGECPFYGMVGNDFAGKP